MTPTYRATQTHLPIAGLDLRPRCRGCDEPFDPRASGRPRRKCETCSPPRYPRIGDPGWSVRPSVLDQLGITSVHEAFGWPLPGVELDILGFARGGLARIRAPGQPPTWIPREGLVRAKAPRAARPAA